MLENKYDPREAWKAMREISSMFAGHIKSAVTTRMRKKDGTIAKTEAENGAVFCEHFNGVFNAPATAQDGIEEVIEQRETVPALGVRPTDDEINYQRAINAEKQTRIASLRELPMFGMFWPMSITLKSTSILR